MFRPILSLFAVCSLVACDEGVDCTDSATYSVTVSVYDAAGEPYAPERVTYAVDGSAEEPCEPISNGTEFLCGLEEIGVFDIRVFVDGVEAARETIEVDLRPDGCHVASEFIDVTV